MKRTFKILVVGLTLSASNVCAMAQNFNDAKYLRGAVPEEQGLVVFQQHFNCEGKSQTQIYTVLADYSKSLLKSPVALQHCRLTKDSPAEGIIAASMEETLTFKSTNWTLDTARFFYHLVFTAQDGGFDAVLRRIRYIYGPMEVEGIDSSITAENWITDANALNRKGHLNRISGKRFRVRTIDRKNHIFVSAYEAVMKSLE